ncbi:MAG: Ig-like domain repeat protein, partial [Methanobrevibacter arboriphilus]
VGTNAIITGQLANFTGIGSFNVTIDGNTQLVIINSTGGWNLTYLTNHTGTYAVTVEYTESDTGNFTGFVNSTSFDVLKNSTNSTIDVAGDFKVGENISISGILADEDSDPINNAQMTIIIGNESFNVTTNSSGVWSLVYAPIHGGEFLILVNWAGNDNYTGFNNSTSFNVSKLASNSSIVIPVDIKVNETVLISGVLSDENNNTISGANLEVIVGGESFNVTTDSVGVWGLNFTSEHSGVFNLSLFYQGDDLYVGFVENMAFNVSKLATTSSIVIPSNVKVGKSFSVSGVLTSGGKPLANTSVLVIVDGKTYKVTTNSDGVWKLSYTPKIAGKSTMKVSFAGDKDYLGFNVSKTFNVIGKAKISIVKISKLVKVGKYRGFNLYSKVYTIKNVGSAVGSKDYVKYFKNWYLEKLSKTSKIVKYQFSTKSRILKVQVKNLGVGKQVKLKILVTHRKRL